MSTSNSPYKKLKREASRIAKVLKAAERGEKIFGANGSNFPPPYLTPTITIGIAQDDKITQLEISWKRIHDTSENALLEYILKILRGKTEEKPQ